MAFETFICPVCGGESQIEAGKHAVCPYCAKELIASPAQDFAFAPLPQYPQQPNTGFAQNMQFAPPPVPMQQPNVFVQPMPAAPFAAQAPQLQYSLEDIRTANQVRRQWKRRDRIVVLIQALILALCVGLNDFGSNLDVPVMLAWMCTVPLSGVLSAVKRPDEAFIEKKPLFKHRLTHGIMHALFSIPASFLTGAALYAIAELLTEIF